MSRKTPHLPVRSKLADTSTDTQSMKHASHSSARPPAPVGSKPARERILVVDDNGAILEDFRRIFADQPNQTSPSHEELNALEQELFSVPKPTTTSTLYRIETVTSGQKGFQIVQESLRNQDPYALAFVDIRMPGGWNGVETVRNIVQQDDFIQIVICTAYSDFRWDEVLETVGRAKHIHLLRKPFNPSQVRTFAQVLTTKWSRLRRAAGPH